MAKINTYTIKDKILVVDSAYEYEIESEKLRKDNWIPKFNIVCKTKTNRHGETEVVIMQHWNKKTKNV